jgi:SlyX protein
MVTVALPTSATHPLSTKAALLVNFQAGTCDDFDVHGHFIAQGKDRSLAASEDRLTTLEIRAAEQERTIEELSGQIADQWKTIERLQKKLDTLADRFMALEEQTAPDVPVTKPPHW